MGHGRRRDGSQHPQLAAPPAVVPDGGRTLAPPPITSSDPPTDRLRAVDTDVVLDRADGTSIQLRRPWDADQLEDIDAHEVTWSPEGDRVAVWCEYGPILVFGSDGSPAGEFHDHWKGPTYGVELAVDG